MSDLKFLIQHVLEKGGKNSTGCSSLSGSLPRQLASLTPEHRKHLNRLIQARKQGPLQYVLGSTPFLHLQLKTTPPTLIPRSETEEWTHALIQAYQTKRRVPRTIVDIGCGSGCIGLALVSAFPQSQLHGYDLKQHAVDLATHNAAIHQCASVTTFHRADVFQLDRLPYPVDLLVANPPYIANHLWETLDTDVRHWEDRQALLGGESGMDFYKPLLELAKKSIARPPEHTDVPCFAVEIGHDQGERIKELAQKYFDKVYLGQDFAGQDRFLWGYGIKQ